MNLRSRMELVVATDRALTQASRRGPIVYRHVYFWEWRLNSNQIARWWLRPSGFIDATIRYVE